MPAPRLGTTVCPGRLDTRPGAVSHLALLLQVLSSYPINNMVGAPIVYRMLVQQDLSR